jgi:hypothetical protein
MDKTRKISKKLRITSISGVGRPAQRPAVVTMLKSRDDANKESGMAADHGTMVPCPYCAGVGYKFTTIDDPAPFAATKSAEAAEATAAIRKAKADNAYQQIRKMAEQERARVGDFRPFALESAVSRVMKTAEGRRLLMEYNANRPDLS